MPIPTGGAGTGTGTGQAGQSSSSAAGSSSSPKTISNLKGSRALRKLRIAYFIFHFITIGIGFTLIVTSSLAQNSETQTIHILNLHVTRGISVTAYVTGAGSIIAGGIGLAALFLDKKPYLWVIYCMLMAALTLLAFAGAVSSAKKQGGLSIKKEMYSLIGAYHFTAAASEGGGGMKQTPEEIKVDTFQTQYKCCGVESYSDWQEVEFGRTSLKLPISCCIHHPSSSSPSPSCGDLCLPDHELLNSTINTAGCFKKMTMEVVKKIVWLTTVGAILCSQTLFLFILSCYLVVSKKA